MLRQLQFYIGQTLDPYHNLAIEKHLFDTVPADGCLLYLWQNEHTVVIGRNQNPWEECRCALLEEEGGKLARRLSGGGAVYHDIGNLNFTFLCPTDCYDLDKQLQVIQTACRMAGIDTTLSGRNDILADGRKFSGNAFYHSHGHSYHHGTLLINADMQRVARYLTPAKAKLESKGVKSVRSRVVNLRELAPTLTVDAMTTYMTAAFEQVYGLPLTERQQIDREAVKQLADAYSSWDFLYGKPMPFTLACDGRFPWGQVALRLQVRDGIIRDAQVFTDAMDWQLAEQLQTALVGCRLTAQDITAALPSAVADDIGDLIKQQIL